MSELRIVDLDSTDLTWGSHTIAGSELPADIVMLRMDAEAGTRSCVVAFPEGWERAVTGNQPAGEEMVLLSGGITMSGLPVAVGEALIVEPRATRSATVTSGATAAVVWFSGPGGGWADGEADDAGSATVVSLTDGELRAPAPGLLGTLLGRDAVAGEVFDTDVEVLWPAARRWAFVPAGVEVPDLPGFAVVHTY